MKTQPNTLKAPEQSPISVFPTRRSFLTQAIGGTALVLGGLPLLTTKVMAAETCVACNDAMTDVDILNYALTLEHLENAFYRDGLARFNERNFRKAKFLKRHTKYIERTVYSNFKLIAEHERVHVATLISVIQSLGGTPVNELCYNFGYTTVDGFVKIAQLLENTGVMAYDGAISLICSPELQTSGATIATVEARHASYLNLLNGQNPFPDAFDTPKTMAEILAAAGGFIVPCP